MKALVGWTAGCLAIAALLFCMLDCGLGEPLVTPARVTHAHYVPAHSWTTMECVSHDSKTGACQSWMAESQYEPEHYYAYIASDLGSGQLDSRALYDLAPSGRCTAHFSRGKWTGRTWGPLRCDPEASW